MFLGGTIFYDYASLVIRVEPQVSLDRDNNTQSTRHFEFVSMDLGIGIQGYHGYNGIFTSRGFEDFIS